MQTASAIQVGAPRLWRCTVGQYDRMAAEGLFDGARVELIEGRIVLMAAQYEPHVAGVSLAARAVEQAFGPRFWVRRQNPIRLGKRSKPEPDVAVVPGSEADYIDSGGPDNPLLIIEVSDTTLRYNRATKAALYARFRVADYWILNLIDRQLEVHRDPIRDPAHPLKYRYASITALRGDERVSPLTATHAEIAVAQIMPKESARAARTRGPSAEAF